MMFKKRNRRGAKVFNLGRRIKYVVRKCQKLLCDEKIYFDFKVLLPYCRKRVCQTYSSFHGASFFLCQLCFLSFDEIRFYTFFFQILVSLATFSFFHFVRVLDQLIRRTCYMNPPVKNIASLKYSVANYTNRYSLGKILCAELSSY